jgi:hypothetical protein
VLRAIAGTGAAAEGERPPGNVSGRLRCLTLFTPIRAQYVPAMRLVLRIGSRLRLRPARRHILQFNFILFVRWAIVDEFPYNGAPQERDRVNHQYLHFESNFDVPWRKYIDAFAYVIPLDITALWGRGPAFPGPPPAEPLKEWIARNSLEDGYYYAAYPEASTKMVVGSLRLSDRLAELRNRAPDMRPEEFAAAWKRFLTDVQRYL